MRIVDIFCNDCDCFHTAPQVLPGKSPACPRCGGETRFATASEAEERAEALSDRLFGAIPQLFRRA